MLKFIFSKKRNSTLILLFLILLLGAFFRFYRIREYLTFLGDEGRDVLVLKRMIVDGKFTLLGPITSVGSIYMGPIYYYFMAPFLWLWHFDPVGPAVMVVLFALATIILIFIVGNQYFHSSAGVIGALLYSISPLPISYGKSSWNPNVVPFFALLIIYSLLNVVVQKRYKWFIVTGLCLGIIFQLHYVTLMFIPIVVVCLSIIQFRLPLKYYVLSALAFLSSYSPFLLFELRHQFVNLQGVVRFLSEQRFTSTPSIFFTIWGSTLEILVRVFWRLVILENAEITKLFILLLGIILFVYRRQLRRKAETYQALKIIFIWIVIGILSFGLYRGAIYDYYFGSFFTAPYLITGILFSAVWQYSKKGKRWVIPLLTIIVFFNLKYSPLWTSPSNLLANSETIARFVYQKTGGKPYNFALIAGKNSDHAYRYFLEIWGHPPITILPESIDSDRSSVTDQLLVICEEKVCQPLGHPLWEIAGFGRAVITDEWQVVTAKVFRLVHYRV